MLKNKNKWFYAFIVAAVLLLAAAVAIVVISGNTEQPPQGDVVIAPGEETGVYYYEVEQGEILLSLNNGNKFTIAGPGVNRTGTYTVDGQNVAFTFVQGNDTASAVLGKDVVTMTFNGAVMTFLKQVNYTVTFETDGGDAIAPVSVCNGKFVQMPATPAKDGYVFIGWYADAACETMYTFADAITADTTVYAGWVKKEVGVNEYTANFVLGYDGAEELPGMDTINGQLYNVPQPTREGYTFGGWFISAYEDGRKLTAMWNEDTVLNANTTLYAVWHANGGAQLASPDVSVSATGMRWNPVSGASAYEVSVLDAKGNVIHQESVGSTSMNFDFAELAAGDYTVEVVAASSNTANNSVATVRYFRNKALERVSKFQVIDGMLIFNTVENAQEYLITIDCGNKDHNHTLLKNGASTVYNFSNCQMQEGGIRFTVTATAKGYLDSVSNVFVYERSLAGVENLVHDAENDCFVWDPVADAAAYMVTVTVGNNTLQFNNGTSNRFSLAAFTGAITVSVTPVTEGYNAPAAATASCTKTAPAAPQNVTVNNMVITWDAVEGATKYEVKVGGETYEVTTNSLDLVEEKFDASVGVEYPILVKAFAGNEASSYSETVNALYKTMDPELSYSNNTISWTPVLGASNFNVRVNGGEVISVSGVNGVQVKLTQAGVNVIEVKCADLSSSEWVSLEVYAYEVIYNSRTVTGGEVKEYLAIGDSMLLPQEFTNEGYNFAGWYNTPGAANGNGKEYTSTVFAGNGDMILFANWSPKEYDVQFIVDGHITNITNESTQKVTYTKHFKLPVAETSDKSLGYFVGWYNGPSGTGIQITDSEGNSVAPYDVIGKTVVYPYFADAIVFEELSDGTYGVKKGLGITNKSITEVLIPETYMDKPVTQILDNGFQKCYNIVSIKMPDTITRVGIGAFERCDSLESIEVYTVDPNSTAKKIYASDNGALLFYDEASGKTYLEFFPVAKTGIYTVPEVVDNIRPYAFKNSELTKVIISKGVTYIAENAFYKCYNLTAIEFEFGRENSVTIEDGAFNDLPRVEILILPAKLNQINDLRMLDRLDALKNIEVEEGGENYSSSNNMLCDGMGISLLYVPNSFAGVLEVPMGITSIGQGVFTGKSQITEVIIPEYVTEIGSSAFYGCSKLRKVTICGPRNDALQIGSSAFQGCRSLREVVFEGGKGSIGGEITIGAYAFANCESLETFTVGESVVIGTIGNGAFNNDAMLDTLQIDDTAVIRQIGNNAFEGCLSIKKFVVHASTTSIGDYAFSGCSYLEAVEFAPNGSQIAFGQGVFKDCSRLSTIQLPATLSAFDGSVFDGCENITTVEVEAGNTFLETKDGALYTAGLTELIYYPRNLDGDLSKLPWDTLTKIGPSVFKGNVKITSVVIGDKVTEIGNNAFDSCINLESVTFSNMNSSMVIGDSAFNGCTKLTAIEVPAQTTSIGANAFYMTKLSAFTIPATVTNIGNLAFAYTDLTSIHIPAAVTNIGQGAFYKATKLATVTFEGGTEPMTLGSFVSKVDGDRSRGVFEGTSLTTIDLPANISFIGSSTFSELTNLTAVNIPAEAQITGIGDYAFYKTSITAINLGQSATEIGKYAFALTKLTTITIPATVQHLRAYALSTSTLTEILFAEGAPAGSNLTIYDYAMVGTSITELTLPSHLIQIGEYVTTYAYHAVGNVFYQDAASSRPAGVGNTTTLTKVHVAEGGTYFGSKDGILYAKNDKGELAEALFCPKGNTGDVVIPNTVVYVQHSAFLDTQLSSIVFEEFPKDDPRYGTQLLTIGAFDGMDGNTPAVIGSRSTTHYTQLTLIQFPSHLKALYSYSVYGLNVQPGSGVANLVVKFNPDSMVSFMGHAMRNNSAIVELQLPKLEVVGTYAFYSNANVTTLTIEKGSTVKELGPYAFASLAKVTSIEIPASVTTLAKNCFYQCSALKSFSQEAGGNLQTIGDEAFSYCYAFTSFKIPDTVTVVGSKAFRMCQALVTLELSANMETAATGNSSIVEECAALQAIVVPENHAYLTSVDGVLYDKQLTILYIYPQAKGAMTTPIPDTVHTIEGGAFHRYQGSSLQLPASLRYIRSYAFTYSNLENVVIPASVLEINKNAFQYCQKMTSLTFEEGSKLERIDENAFAGCNALLALRLPDSVTTIGQQAFSSNIKLTELVLPAALRNLGNFAFNSCKGLTSVIMQEGLEEIGNNAFANCSSVTSFTIPDSVKKLGNYVFQNCHAMEEVLMSENSQMKQIGNGVFQYCYGLKKAILGPQIDTFGLVVFGDSTNLVEVRLPDALTSVPDKLFQNCIYLTTVNIPAQATSIGSNAFAGCIALQEITFGENLKSIGANAFANCTALTTVHVNSSCALEIIGSSAFENTTALGGIALPNTVIEIGSAAFRNSGIATAPIPANLTKIGDYAFYGCANLTTIGIPSTVSTVGAYAFAGCENVETLALAVGVKNIGDFAFADCVKIKEVTIPESVNFMGSNPFANCTGLESLALDSSNESFVIKDGVLFDATMYSLICYPSYKAGATYEIPAEVDEIAGGAFAGSQLQSIVVPDTVSKIADSAFRNSRNLESVVISNNVSSIAARTFEDCVKLNNVVIPAAVASLGDYAFAGCASLTNLILEDRKIDMTVGSHLFEGCTALTTVFTFPGVTKFTDYMYANTGFVDLVIPDEYIFLNGEGVFAYCANLKSVQFPANPGTSLGGRFFKGCVSLISVDIPAGISKLGSSAITGVPAIGEVFMDCTSLQRVTTYATQLEGVSTFENCTSLTTFVAGQTMDSVERMFANCTSLTNDALQYIYNIKKETFLNCTGFAGEVDLSHVYNFEEYGLSGCVNLTNIILGNSEMQISQHGFTGLTANTNIFFKSITSLEKALNRSGNTGWDQYTEATFTFKEVSGGNQIDYSLTADEQEMLQRFCDNNGIRDTSEIEALWVAYKTNYRDLNPADRLDREESAMLYDFLASYRLSEKLYDELADQWVAYKKTLTQQLLAIYGLTDEESTMVQNFCDENRLRDMYDYVSAQLIAYKMNFTETNPPKELDREELGMLMNFLESCGLRVGDKELDGYAQQWLEYRADLAKRNNPPTVSYLTEEELNELYRFADRNGLSEDMVEAIKAAWSDYKLNFTDTKADERLSREDFAELESFLMDLGLSGRELDPVLNAMAEQWPAYRMKLAEKNAQAAITREEYAWIEEFVGGYRLDRELTDELQTALFNYKRFFSETEVSKELSEEELAQLTAFLEELGLAEDDRLFTSLVDQWLQYKQQLVKAAGGGDSGGGR